MTGLTPRSGGPPSRRAREKRAYQLVVAGSTAGALTVVGVVLAVVGVIGFGLPVIAFLIALACAFGFRRTVS